MQPKTKDFKSGAADALQNPRIQENLLGLYNGFHAARIAAADATPDWEAMRDLARQVKAHTIDNLDYYLDLAATNVEKAGGKVFFAKDAAAASAYVIDLARERGVELVIKGKSMVSEEMELNPYLARHGVSATEADLGEFIVQLAEQPPSHIIAPAIHFNKEEIANLFQDKLEERCHHASRQRSAISSPVSAK